MDSKESLAHKQSVNNYHWMVATTNEMFLNLYAKVSIFESSIFFKATSLFVIVWYLHCWCDNNIKVAILDLLTNTP